MFFSYYLIQLDYLSELVLAYAVLPAKQSIIKLEHYLFSLSKRVCICTYRPIKLIG